MGIRGKIFTTITLIALAAISFVYFRPPSDFYTEAAIVSYLNKQQPQFAAKEIVDIVYLDDKHVFIPFISEHDEAGMLLFAWRSGEWKHVKTSVNYEKYLWQFDTRDPSTTYIVWHHRFDEEVRLQVDVERSYQLTRFHEGDVIYTPGVHLKDVRDINKNYGVYKVSEEWAEVMDPKKDHSLTERLFMSAFYSGYTFTAMFIDENNEEVFRKHGGGSAFGNGIKNMYVQPL